MYIYIVAMNPSVFVDEDVLGLGVYKQTGPWFSCVWVNFMAKHSINSNEPGFESKICPTRPINIFGLLKTIFGSYQLNRIHLAHKYNWT